MKIYPDTTVYVACIANFASGGPELLYQLASHLMKRNVNVKMIYFNRTEADPVHEFYKKYHIPVAESVENSSNAGILAGKTVGSCSLSS